MKRWIGRKVPQPWSQRKLGSQAHRAFARGPSFRRGDGKKRGPH